MDSLEKDRAFLKFSDAIENFKKDVMNLVNEICKDIHPIPVSRALSDITFDLRFSARFKEEFAIYMDKYLNEE